MSIKKITIFLIVFVASMIIGMKYVKADDIALYIACTYKPSDIPSVSKTDDITIYYSQLLNKKGEQFQIRASADSARDIYASYDSAYQRITLGDIEQYFKYNVNYNASSNSKFLEAMKNNSNSCPKYMTMEWNNKDSQKAMFYNNLANSDNCKSGTSANSSCKAIYELRETVANVRANTEEDVWVIKANDDDEKACKGLTVTFSLTGNRLHAQAVYDETANATYKEYTNQEGPTLVTHYTFDDIEHLALYGFFNRQFKETVLDSNNGSVNQNLGKIYINPRETSDDDYEIQLDAEADGMNCFFCDKCVIKATEEYPLKKEKNCAFDTTIYNNDTYFSMELANYNNVKNDYEKIKNFATYADISKINISMLTDAADKIEKLIGNSSTVGQETTGTIDLYNDSSQALQTHIETRFTKENGYCESWINGTLNDLKQGMKERYEEIQKIAESLSKTSSELAARAEVLGNEEATTKLTQMSQDAEGLAEELLILIERVQNSMLDDLDLNLSGISSAGCGVLSVDMKKFLKLVLWYIRIAGVVLAIVLSLVDYIKAAAGSDDKSMAAANKKFVTRVILVAVLFLIPVILEFLLNTLNISTTAGSISCLD